MLKPFLCTILEKREEITWKSRGRMHKHTIGLLAGIIFILLLTGCPGTSSSAPPRVYINLDFTDDSGDTDGLFMSRTLETDDAEEIYLELDLSDFYDAAGAAPEVYYIFTNTDPDEDSPTRPVITETGDDSSSISSSSSRSSTEAAPAARDMPVFSAPIALRGLPQTADESEEAASRSLSRGAAISLQPGNDEVGDTADFLIDTYTIGEEELTTTISSRPATCRAVIEDVHGVTLNIWVADDCWDYGSGDEEKTFLVNTTMTDAMADAFLQTGDDNDIYEWITGIFGEEWGADQAAAGYIEDNDEITIFLYDIDGDGGNSDAPYDTSVGSYTAGFFWSVDNYSHNKRLMFYIDAPVFACGDDPYTVDLETGWDVSNYYPADQISTLAHEFQHMIQYYQKQVKQNLGNTDTWINEMCSLMAEDFISDRLGVAGPRGVLIDGDFSGTVSSTEIPVTNGRIPEFNLYDDVSLTSWNSTTEEETPVSLILVDYALAYTFGAYLGRNYGGTALFREIAQNGYTNEEAVVQAVSSIGANGAAPPDFGELLAEWGAAVILSDEVREEEPLLFNSNSSGFSSSAETAGLTYTLGGINFYNYLCTETPVSSGGGPPQVEVTTGPYLYGTSGTFGATDQYFSTHQAASNIYYQDTRVAEIMQRGFFVGSGVKLTVVVKE